MNKQILFFLVYLQGIALFAQKQNDPSSIPLNAGGLTFDSALTVINSKEASLGKKYGIIKSITNQVYYDGLTLLFNKVLREAEVHRNDSTQMQMYNRLAGLNMNHNDFDRAKLYLDSASYYKNRVDNPFVLMYFYDYMGSYSLYAGERDKANEYIYKSIEYAEKVGSQEERIVHKYSYLSNMYFQENDMTAVRRIIAKMQHQALKVDNPLIDFLINNIQAMYYVMRSNSLIPGNETKEFNLISDSINYHCQKMIYLYENTPDKNNLLMWEDGIAIAYLNLVTAEAMRTDPDWDKVLKNIEKVESLNIPVNNNRMYLLYLQRKSTAYYIQGKYQLSINGFLELLELINYSIEHSGADHSQYFETIQQTAYLSLASNYEAIGNYKKAYEYKVLEAGRIAEDVKKNMYKAMKEVETKYDVKAKEREIEVLTEQNLYQQKIRYLFGGISLLLLAIILILIYLFKIRRKAALKDLEIIQMEKDEIELQISLKEEQARLAELEKYNALSEMRLIRLEADDKEQELVNLRKYKEELDKQIELYSSNLQHYEALMSKNKERKMTELLIEELVTFINNKLESRSEKYIPKLERINDRFIEKLSTNNISKTYIKYCICFVIDMDMKDIARFFSVEVSSVHVMRYRLKSKLNLGNETDLNLYLFDLLQDSLQQ